MPVGTVTRSQIITDFQVNGFTFLNRTAKHEFAENEIISGVQGSILGETTTNITRDGGITLPFTPSHLRTLYALQDILIQLPQLTLAFSSKEGSEFTFEIGYVVQLKIAGETVLSEFTGEIVKMKENKNKRITGSHGPVIKQVQLQQDYRVPPGVSVELVVTGFFRLMGEGEDSESLTLRSNSPAQFKATIAYEQEFSPSKG